MATQADRLLDRVIVFPSGEAFERSSALTDFRRDRDEARILYLCKRVSQSQSAGLDRRDNEFVVKVKFQVSRPDDSAQPSTQPSATTQDEVKALRRFGDYGFSFVPHLVAFKVLAQPDADGDAGDAFLPGGYIAITIMTKMPGATIWDLKFWSMPEAEREEIRDLFWKQLQQLWSVGLQPYDRALRNVMWDRETKKCSIIDFEHWTPCQWNSADSPEVVSAEDDQQNRRLELQRWGLLQRPAPASWAQEWGLLK